MIRRFNTELLHAAIAQVFNNDIVKKIPVDDCKGIDGIGAGFEAKVQLPVFDDFIEEADA